MFCFEVGPDWPQTHHVAKDDLKLGILLHPPSKSWIIGMYPPQPVHTVLSVKPGAMCMLGRHSAR